MIAATLFFVGLIALIIGSLTDLDRHEVPDWVNYGLIFSGFGLRLLESLIAGEYTSLLYGLYGFIFYYIIGMLMFYTGQWGGGDSKMLMGLGVVFVFYPTILENLFNPVLGNVPFLLTFLLNIVLFGGIYGIFWAIYFVLKNIKGFKKKFLDNLKLKKNLKYRRLTLITVFSLLILSLFTLYFGRVLPLYLFAISFFLYFSFYLSVALKSIEKISMCKNIPPEKLTLGDWIVNDIRVKNSKKLTFFDFLKGNRKPDFFFRLKYIKEDINIILDYRFSKIKKKVDNEFYESLKKRFASDILYELFLKENRPFQKITFILNRQRFVDTYSKDMKKIYGLLESYSSKEDEKILKKINELYNYDFLKNEYRVTGPGDLGIEDYQIAELIENAKKKKIDTVLIKEGIPFVPSFLFAFIFSIIWGNAALLFF